MATVWFGGEGSPWQGGPIKAIFDRKAEPRGRSPKRKKAIKIRTDQSNQIRAIMEMVDRRKNAKQSQVFGNFMMMKRRKEEWRNGRRNMCGMCEMCGRKKSWWGFTWSWSRGITMPRLNEGQSKGKNGRIRAGRRAPRKIKS